MEFSRDGAEFLARYQGLVLDPRLSTGSPHDKADILRGVLSQLTYAQTSNIISSEASRRVERSYEDLYANVVDSFDGETGLNNYADAALALCSGNKNESQQWSCSLSKDKLASLPCLQALRRDVQAANNKPSSSSSRDEPLPFCASKKSKPSETQPTNAINTVSSCRNRPPPDNTCPNQGRGQFTDRVMDLYTKQQEVVADRQPAGQNRRGQSGAALDAEADKDLRQQRKPLFSSGGSVFGQYGGNTSSSTTRGNRYPAEQPTSMERGHRATDERTDGSGRETGHPGPDSATTNAFLTARQQLHIDQQRKYGGGAKGGQQAAGSVSTTAYGTGKKSLGTRRGLNSRFVPPVINREDDGNEAAMMVTRAVLKTGQGDAGAVVDERLKGIEAKMVELIMNEIMDHGPHVGWDDVAGLEFAKKTIKEIVVWPMLRPDIFTGLRGPPKGLLLFGPPGTGKTLIGKCIASQSKSTFFCISASSLTSKWVGEGEKMVRALFAVARTRQPAVVFIDEIDSLLTQRTDGENEASRRIKTEFLVQLDGASTDAEDRILIIGATNRPQEIDEAARRRFVKRLFIALPEVDARCTIILNLLRQQSYELSTDQLTEICTRTDGFSGADMATLCREAALGPIRDMSFGDIEHIMADQVRPITCADFEDALLSVKPSVSARDLDAYLDWNKTFGSGCR